MPELSSWNAARRGTGVRSVAASCTFVVEVRGVPELMLSWGGGGSGTRYLRADANSNVLMERSWGEIGNARRRGSYAMRIAPGHCTFPRVYKQRTHWVCYCSILVTYL